MIARLTLSYDGTAYAGWQRQENALSVQQVVEEALADLLGEPLRLHGAGRTDAGVHAQGQVAHLTLPRPFSLRGLVHGTNHRLPPDIRVMGADRMEEGFHARKSALGKEYRYRVVQARVVSPLEARWCWRVEQRLDLGAMRQAAHRVAGRHDFTAFALAGGSHRQPFRRVFAVHLEDRGRVLDLRFWGEGFLRGMVRVLAGTLIEIGRGQRETEEMSRLLAGADRSAAGVTAPAAGLTLEKVFYGPCWPSLDSYRAG